MNPSLVNFLYTGGFGAALFLGGADLMFGENSMTPYFAGPTSVWNEWSSRAFGAQLLGLASGYFFGGKDAKSAHGKMFNKANFVAGVLMLPLMFYGAFSGESAFNSPMWKLQIGVHIPVIYMSYKAGFGSGESKSA